jgi:hypothetical protein
MPLDYKAIYDAEFEQREHLRSALSTPIGLLTLFGGLIGYTLQKVRLEFAWWSILFLVSTAFVAVLLGLSTYFLIRAMHGHVYRQLKPAGVLREYHRQLREWHSNNGLGPLAGDREFDEYLEKSYVEASDHNQRINRERSEYLFLCNRWLIRVVVSAVVLLIAFGMAVQAQSQPRGNPSGKSTTNQPEESHGQPTPVRAGTASKAGAPAAGRHPRGTHPTSGAPAVRR